MKAITNIRPEVSHTSFSIIFTTLLYVTCNALNFDKIVKWFYLGDSINYSALFAYYLFGLALFIAFFLLFAHRWTIKPLAFIIIILSAAATYFSSKYNVVLDSSMVMNTLNTDYIEVRGLLTTQMIPYLIFLIILPGIAVYAVDITFQSSAKYLFSSLKLFILVLVIGIGSVYIKFDSIHRATNLSRKYIIHTLVPVNYIRSTISVINRSLEPYYANSKKEVEITGHITSHDDLVVALVIGESSRQKSFSLYGYDRRNTNPELSNDNGLHMLNGIARIGTTLYALTEILEKDDIKLPAITSKLGIDTSCYANYSLNDNCTSVGEIKVDNCQHDGNCYDEDVIPLLENNLNSYVSGYRFIVLHLGGGSHGPSYHDRYPQEFQHFKPMCFDADVVNQCTIDEIYNSYDNTILYVDHVLGKIIKTLDHSGAPYVFIYLSDHGESLLEDGRIFHGMPPGIPLPPEQAQIPLIVKSSIDISIAEREEYTQPDVFSTVLDLFSIETDILNKQGGFIQKR